MGPDDSMVMKTSFRVVLGKYKDFLGRKEVEY